MSGRVPEIGSGHDLGHGEIHHGFAPVDFLVAIPGIVQDPGRFALGKGAEGMHPHLVGEPIQRSSRRGHVIAVAEFVLVRNSVHHRVQAVHIGSHPDRFLLDARINFRDRLDLRD